MAITVASMEIRQGAGRQILTRGIQGSEEFSNYGHIFYLDTHDDHEDNDEVRIVIRRRRRRMSAYYLSIRYQKRTK